MTPTATYIIMPVFFILILCVGTWSLLHQRMLRNMNTPVYSIFDLENQRFYRQYNPNESPEVYTEWVDLLMKVRRKPNCLTKYELDLLFPARKLKDAESIVTPFLSTDNAAEEEEEKEEKTVNMATINENTVGSELSTHLDSKNVATITTLNLTQTSDDNNTPSTAKQKDTSIGSDGDNTNINNQASISITEKDITEIEIIPVDDDQTILNTTTNNINNETSSNIKQQQQQSQEKHYPHQTDSSQHHPFADIICSICQAVIGKEDIEDWELDNVQRDETVEVRVLSCNHCFHDKCISPWLLDRRADCPLCKRTLINEVSIDMLKMEIEQVCGNNQN